jgi:hypothetical protein
MNAYANETAFARFQVDVADIIDFEQTAIGHRRMVPITGGTVTGAIGSGVILPGTDWQWIMSDGTVSLDAHYALKLETGELVEVESRGIRHVDSAGLMYFRTSIRLTTAADRPDINQRMFTSVGSRLENQVILDLYPVL